MCVRMKALRADAISSHVHSVTCTTATCIHTRHLPLGACPRRRTATLRVERLHTKLRVHKHMLCTCNRAHTHIHTHAHGIHARQYNTCARTQARTRTRKHAPTLTRTPCIHAKTHPTRRAHKDKTCLQAQNTCIYTLRTRKHGHAHARTHVGILAHVRSCTLHPRTGYVTAWRAALCGGLRPSGCPFACLLSAAWVPNTGGAAARASVLQGWCSCSVALHNVASPTVT